ncbi:MAG: hypothetical protein ACKOE6_09085, partial [Flammeovirgaceae bacterium]
VKLLGAFQRVLFEFGQVVFVEDEQRLAGHVLDKNNLPKFKENALKRAKEFDISKILPLYENYYEKILEKAAVKAAL